MKSLTFTLLFILFSRASGQDHATLDSAWASRHTWKQAHSCAEELLDLWNEYKGKCYADSTLEFEVDTQGWLKADAWRGMVKHYEWARVITDYRYSHKPATLEGFITFLEEKAWLWRSRVRVNEMREISRRIKERMQ